MDDEWRMAPAVRRPRSAATAGLAFGLIPTGVLVLLQSAEPGSVARSGDRLTDLERRDGVSKALALVPYAGIALPWREHAHREPIPLTHGG